LDLVVEEVAGPGVPPELPDDPDAKGSGLRGGRLRVSSEVGHGTTVRAELPLRG
jgi:signal transduction histidine kinase